MLPVMHTGVLLSVFRMQHFESSQTLILSPKQSDRGRPYCPSPGLSDWKEVSIRQGHFRDIADDCNRFFLNSRVAEFARWAYKNPSAPWLTNCPPPPPKLRTAFRRRSAPVKARAGRPRSPPPAPRCAARTSRGPRAEAATWNARHGGRRRRHPFPQMFSEKLNFSG